MALIPDIALIRCRRLPAAAGGEDDSHAGGMRPCAAWEQEQGPVGAARVTLPGAGLSGGSDFCLLVAAVPVSLCQARFGKGLGQPVAVRCLWTHTFCCLPCLDGARAACGQDSRLWAGWGIYPFWARKQSTYPAAMGSTDVLLIQKPGELLPRLP